MTWNTRKTKQTKFFLTNTTEIPSTLVEIPEKRIERDSRLRFGVSSGRSETVIDRRFISQFPFGVDSTVGTLYAINPGSDLYLLAPPGLEWRGRFDSDLRYDLNDIFEIQGRYFRPIEYLKTNFPNEVRSRQRIDIDAFDFEKEEVTVRLYNFPPEGGSFILPGGYRFIKIDYISVHNLEKILLNYAFENICTEPFEREFCKKTYKDRLDRWGIVASALDFIIENQAAMLPNWSVETFEEARSTLNLDTNINKTVSENLKILVNFLERRSPLFEVQKVSDVRSSQFDDFFGSYNKAESPILGRSPGVYKADYDTNRIINVSWERFFIPLRELDAGDIVVLSDYSVAWRFAPRPIYDPDLRADLGLSKIPKENSKEELYSPLDPRSWIEIDISTIERPITDWLMSPFDSVFFDLLFKTQQFLYLALFIHTNVNEYVDYSAQFFGLQLNETGMLISQKRNLIKNLLEWDYEIDGNSVPRVDTIKVGDYFVVEDRSHSNRCSVFLTTDNFNYQVGDKVYLTGTNVSDEVRALIHNYGLKLHISPDEFGEDTEIQIVHNIFLSNRKKRDTSFIPGWKQDDLYQFNDFDFFKKGRFISITPYVETRIPFDPQYAYNFPFYANSRYKSFDGSNFTIKDIEGNIIIANSDRFTCPEDTFIIETDNGLTFTISEIYQRRRLRKFNRDELFPSLDFWKGAIKQRGTLLGLIFLMELLDIREHTIDELTFYFVQAKFELNQVGITDTPESLIVDIGSNNFNSLIFTNFYKNLLSYNFSAYSNVIISLPSGSDTSLRDTFPLALTDHTPPLLSDDPYKDDSPLLYIDPNDDPQLDPEGSIRLNIGLYMEDESGSLVLEGDDEGYLLIDNLVFPTSFIVKSGIASFRYENVLPPLIPTIYEPYRLDDNFVLNDAVLDGPEMAKNLVVIRVPYYYKRDGQEWRALESIIRDWIPSWFDYRIQYPYSTSDLSAIGDVFYDPLG